MEPSATLADLGLHPPPVRRPDHGCWLLAMAACIAALSSFVGWNVELWAATTFPLVWAAAAYWPSTFVARHPTAIFVLATFLSGGATNGRIPLLTLVAGGLASRVLHQRWFESFLRA